MLVSSYSNKLPLWRFDKNHCHCEPNLLGEAIYRTTPA